MFKLNNASTIGKHNSHIVFKWYTKSIPYGGLYDELFLNTHCLSAE